MKYIKLLIFLCSTFIYAQDKKFVTLYESTNNAKYYKYTGKGKAYYFEYFDNAKKKIGNQNYYIRYRTYSSGRIDTTYFRKGEKNYYHLNLKTNKESIVLPVEPKLNDTWFESDKSWSYKVIAVNEKFKTPYRKFKGCVKVNCKQILDRDKHKAKEYFLYYDPQFGYVGNVNSRGKILSYLSEQKLNAKEGEVIGNK